eukprot:2457543-Alexandrium_andersonii.AAC.1
MARQVCPEMNGVPRTVCPASGRAAMMRKKKTPGSAASAACAAACAASASSVTKSGVDEKAKSGRGVAAALPSPWLLLL